MAVRWSAWLGSPPTEGPLDRRKNPRGLRRGNDGRCRRERVNEAGEEPEGQPPTRSGLNGNGHDLANGNRRAARQQRTKDSGPNGPNLSDRGWRSQASRSEESSPLASVRWSAWLGDGPAGRLCTGERASGDSGSSTCTTEPTPQPGRQARRLACSAIARDLASKTCTRGPLWVRKVTRKNGMAGRSRERVVA